MPAVSTAQVCQDRLVAGFSNYLSTLPDAPSAGSPPKSNAAAGATKAIATRRTKYGEKTISSTSLSSLIARHKASKSRTRQYPVPPVGAADSEQVDPAEPTDGAECFGAMPNIVTWLSSKSYRR